MSRRVSPTLEIRATADGDRVCCSKCGAALVPAGQPWKPAAALDESPMKGAGGAAYSVSDKVLLRRFTCKGCGTLLDTEMALPGEPFLNDVVSA
ncbi:MAG: acetone carboxylase subunit gamma [Candidatus Eiseniibacteriota bacterium]